MNPKETRELLRRSEVRFENLIKALKRHNLHIDVICHDYIPSKNEVAISHTLTTSCNPKEIAFSYRKGVHENNKKQQSYGSFVRSFLLSVKNSVKRKI